jgi:plastocyanin
MKAALLIVALALALAGSGASAKPPARMLVYAQEWSLWPSRTAMPAGHLVVQMWNRGQDQHDVQIKRLDRSGRMSGRAQGVGIVNSGQIRSATWRLAPGNYELYCSLSGHLHRGMHTRVVVR